MERIKDNPSARPIPRESLVMALMLTVITVLVCILLGEILVPISAGPDLNDLTVDSGPMDPNQWVLNADTTPPDPRTFIERIRPNFFQSPRRLQASKSRDSTVEKVMSQLTLHCVTEVAGQPVAYIKIEGIGLRRCVIGDSVESRFTVLDIQDRTVKIDIAGEQLELNL